MVNDGIFVEVVSAFFDMFIVWRCLINHDIAKT